MKITQEEVQKVAALARLDLTEKEVEQMTRQLDNILSYVAKLDKLDTRGVPVTTHTQNITNAFRADEVRESLARDKALANGPRHNEDAFIVPKIIT
ncbi:MAG: Asp-tRNA(Asn)/Glu-tRNA(Gln) amidotransferase subunit GatB [Desulfobulbus sp.]|nr:MAG: Asp-tRNA(Asn)/Glu-tRNA(Gln) amidotransferase subunit GatB [Desulfobulbus sp.]